MKPRHFLAQLDRDKITAAIRAAEEATSGEIRVFVSHRKLGSDDILQRAAARFEKLGMTATSLRHGVLLYFMPKERRYAVLGDSGIHEKCGKAFWDEVVAGIGDLMRREDFTAAAAHAVEKIGTILAEHFPRGTEDRNELSDEVGED